MGFLYSKRSFRRLLGLIGAILAGVSLPFTGTGSAQAEDAAPAAANYTFLTFNMCGHACGVELGHADAVAISIRDHHPLVAMLQEVCLPELKRIYSDLQAWGLAYGYDFLKTVDNVDGGCGQYGIATVNTGRKDPAYTDSTLLANPHNLERRGLLCILLRDPETIRVCTTHLTSGDTQNDYQNRLSQATDIKNRTDPYIDRGTRTVIGGDFNSKPTSPVMDRFYASQYGGASYGRFYEINGCCSKTGPVTHPDSGRKLDYIFHSNRLTTVSHGVTDSIYSDHRLWFGQVTNA